ncbi:MULTISPECIES: glycosyltransferase [Thomasclavelia]|uniref:glycosyltransferase n=1 Tax=Thomasclavelia TaxID=3025755 RepID=UPI003208F819
MLDAKVLVLLSTYNGEKYLSDLLNSILLQKNVHVDILIRDDGSIDDTINILNSFKSYDNIQVIYGNNIGSKNSFYKLLEICDTSYDYYAFADQDDIWLEDKIYKAIKLLKKNNISPALYLGNYTLVNKHLDFIRISKENRVYPFEKIILKNHILGCTMVFNKQLLKVIKNHQYININNLPFHDHWIYILCSAINGNIVLDSQSYILYRQHENNVVGSIKFKDRIKSSALFKNKKVRYLYINELYKNYRDFIDNDKILLLKECINYTMSYKNKFKFAFFNSLQTNNILERIILIITILLGRF